MLSLARPVAHMVFLTPAPTRGVVMQSRMLSGKNDDHWNSKNTPKFGRRSGVRTRRVKPDTPAEESEEHASSTPAGSSQQMNSVTSTSSTSPTASQQAPPPAQQQSARGGLGGAIADGLASGLGFGLGSRLMDSMFGPRQVEVVHRDEQGGDQPPAGSDSGSTAGAGSGDGQGWFSDSTTSNSEDHGSWFSEDGGDGGGGGWFGDD